jgi:outer membrane protein assembly factor BamB
MPSIGRRTFLGSLAIGAGGGLAGCSSSCPDTEAPEPSTTFGTAGAGQGFDTPPGGAWPAPRFDATNRGYAPSGRIPTDSPTVRWERPLPVGTGADAVASVGAPTVTAGTVFLTTGVGVVALALADGRERWRVTSFTPAGTGPGDADGDVAAPVVDDGTVYVATDGAVVGLAVDDGTVRWRTDDVAPAGTPAVADGTVFVPGGDELSALGAADGEELWTAPVSSAGRLAVAAETVVVAGEDLLGLAATTGERRWTSPVRPESHPVVASETIYCGTYEGVAGVDLHDGRERWSVDRGGGRTYSTPVVTPETVYAVERPGEAGDATFAFDRTADQPPEPRWCSSVGEGAVTAATDDAALSLGRGATDRRAPTRVFAFTDRFGEAAWGYRSAASVAPPAVLDGGAVAATGRGTVVAVGGD